MRARDYGGGVSGGGLSGCSSGAPFGGVPMTLQFGLFDYIIIAVFYALAATLLLLAWLWPRRWRYWKLLIVPVAAAVLIAPWADEMWIAWRFGQLCKDAGVHVYQEVKTDGYYDATTTGWSKSEVVTDVRAIAEYEKAGFRFRERNTSVSGHAPGKISHLEKQPDGAWRVTVIDRPTARYHYKFADPRQEVPVGLKIEKREVLVVDTQTNDVIAREIGYNRYPAWVQRLWIGSFGSGLVQCPDPGKGPPFEHLPTAAIKPLR